MPTEDDDKSVESNQTAPLGMVLSGYAFLNISIQKLRKLWSTFCSHDIIMSPDTYCPEILGYTIKLKKTYFILSNLGSIL